MQKESHQIYFAFMGADLIDIWAPHDILPDLLVGIERKLLPFYKTVTVREPNFYFLTPSSYEGIEYYNLSSRKLKFARELLEYLMTDRGYWIQSQSHEHLTDIYILNSKNKE